MAIELPSVADVEAAAAKWRETQPRFAGLVANYGDLPRALRHFGLLLWEQGLTQDAANVLTGAVTLTPHDSAVWGDLSGALLAGGRALEAADAMQEALLRDPQSAQGWLRLGTIRANLNEPAAAEQAYKTSLSLDPAHADARLSLGLLYFSLKRFTEAATHLKIVLDGVAAPDPAIQACYGQALSHSGDFAAAADALRDAVALDPANVVIARKAAQARYMADLIGGVSYEAAAATCLGWPGMTAAEMDKISRQAFHFLGAYGYSELALRLGEHRLASHPGDLELSYILAVLRGEALKRAPAPYVAAHFDQFASEFDKQLTGVLGYNAYEPLARLSEQHAAGRLAHILDIGCGTGLAGPLLAKPGRHLTGVDLSARMLDKARERGCYDALEIADAVEHLLRYHGTLDLVFAADMVIYLGELTGLMQGAAQALTPGGLFALTIETNTGADIALMPSGRFAHALDYVLREATDAGFAGVTAEAVPLRYETTGFVTGHLILLRRM